MVNIVFNHIRVFVRHLARLAYTALILFCLVVSSQGLANTVTSPDSNVVTVKPVALGDAGALHGTATLSLSEQVNAKRPDDLVQLLPLVAANGLPVSNQKPEKEGDKGHSRTTEEVDDDLTHKAVSLTAMYAGILLLGILISGGPGALTEIFYWKPRDVVLDIWCAVEDYFWWREQRAMEIKAAQKKFDY